MGVKIDKVKREWYVYTTVRDDGDVMDWVKQPWNLHHYTDIFVEASRHMPYTFGHIVAWATGAWVLREIVGYFW